MAERLPDDCSEVGVSNSRPCWYPALLGNDDARSGELPNLVDQFLVIDPHRRAEHYGSKRAESPPSRLSHVDETYSLNTTRGAAFHALFLYLFWHVYAAGEGEPFIHRIVNVGKEI